MRYMVLIRLDDEERSVGEYDGVLYDNKEDAEKVCSEAGEYLDAYIKEVG